MKPFTKENRMQTATSSRFTLFSATIILTILLYSCHAKTGNANVQALEEGLINSNKAFELSSKMAMLSLKNKLDNPSTAEVAKTWLPRARQIREYSKQVYNFIEALYKKEGGPGPSEISSLYERLKRYKDDVIAIDLSIRKIFSNNLVLTTKSFDESDPGIDGFRKTFFSNAGTEDKTAILTKFQNNIKIIENRLLIFCNESSGATWFGSE